MAVRASGAKPRNLYVSSNVVAVAPAMTAAQEQSWNGLLDVGDTLRDGWCLVGGQLVHLHCWERGASPTRPTDDGDAVVDVRGTTAGLHRFTAELVRLGFQSSGETMEGHQHRWVRDAAQIDVLVPTRTAHFTQRRGVTGGTTLETPGAQQALDRTELVEVTVAGRTGTVPRPRLFGAIVAKAAAYTTNDPGRDRHMADFVVLTTLAGRRDYSAETITDRDREYLGHICAMTNNTRHIWTGIQGGEDGLQRLRAAIAVNNH